MQYPLLSNAADASHDGINLLVRVGDFPPTPGVPNSTINCHVPTDDDASNTRSFSGCPITTLPRSNLRQHPLKHGIITSSFADLGRYSNQKGRFGCPTPPYWIKNINNFYTQNTCVSIIVKGGTSYECLIHIKQQSNGLLDRSLLGGCLCWAIYLTHNHHLLHQKLQNLGLFLNYFPTGGYLLNGLTQFLIIIR